ncbi:MAG: DMT family transporter [Bacteroidetes bacterium]|nr:DMT family transporter [Bacteroidota bacterium]
MQLSRKAEIYLLVVTLIWGSTFVITKTSLDQASPLMFLGVRFLIASLIFGAVFHKKIFASKFKPGKAAIFVCLTLFIGFATQTAGLKFTSASHSGFITGLLVIFTPIFQVIIEKKFPNRGVWVGVTLVTIGLYFLVNPSSELSGDVLFGDFLTLICAIVYAIYIVYLDIASRETDIYQLTFYQFITVAVFSFAAAPFFETPFLTSDTDLWTALIYLAVLATIVTTFIQTRFQKDTTPAKAAVIFTMEPVFSAVLAFFVLNEMIGLTGIFGGTLIVIGLLTSELSKS